MFQIGQQIDKTILDNVDLHSTLRTVLDDFLIDVTVYDREGRLMSTNIEPPLALAHDEERTAVAHRGGFEPPRGGHAGAV